MARRTALVTGGAGGIGRAAARALVQRGLAVVLAGRNEDALREAAAELDAGARWVRMDVSDEASVARAFDESGPIDVLVANAGAAASAPLARTDLATWDRMLAVNATGVFLCLRAAVPGMVARGYGRIVVVASTAALKGYAYTAAYSAAKHAALGLVRAAAAELCGSGVTVNAVCPTFVRTKLFEDSVARAAAATGRPADAVEAEFARLSGLGRILEPEEVARAIVFLADEAAAGIHGRCLVLDGPDAPEAGRPERKEEET